METRAKAERKKLETPDSPTSMVPNSSAGEMHEDPVGATFEESIIETLEEVQKFIVNSNKEKEEMKDQLNN